MRSGELGTLRDALDRGREAPRPAGPVAAAPASQRRPLEQGRPDSRSEAAPDTSAAAPPRVGAAALLPLRLFLGITFVYAGLDKLLDPTFFSATDPASIQAQLAAFARVSPLAPLVRLSEPFAVPIGLLIALAEIAIGLGALTGLAYRIAAAGGAAVSLLFFLTASWATRPYYYGPDLPYAAGWLTLALAGHAGLLVPRVILDLGRPAADRRRRARVPGAPPARLDRRTEPAGETGVVSRRIVLQVGVLALATIAVAAATAPLRLFRGSTGGGTAGAGPSPRPSAAPSSGPTAAPTAGASPAGTTGPTGGSLPVARIADVTAGGLPFTVPFDAPAPLPAGDPAVIVRLASGSFVAYDAVCTHEGCTVEWDGQDGVLLCPCHGAAFDAEHDGRVLAGPARRALPSLPLVIDQASGTISLRA